MTKSKAKTFNGPALIAAMMRELDPVFKQKLCEKLAKASPILQKTIEYLEFQFDDLQRLDDASLQLFIRTIPEKEWLIALKTASSSFKERFRACMSERRREDFDQASKSLPKMHKAQVFKVQMQIALKAKSMLQEGKLKMASFRPLKVHKNRMLEQMRQRSQRRAANRPKAAG